MLVRFGSFGEEDNVFTLHSPQLIELLGILWEKRLKIAWMQAYGDCGGSKKSRRLLCFVTEA